MTRLEPIPGVARVSDTIEDLFAQYGVRTTVLALARALVRFRRGPPVHDAGALPDHLRRDVGLPPWDEARRYF